MYKYPITTKSQMVSAIEELSQITRRHVNMSKVNEQVGKLQSLAGHLPPSPKPSLDLKVARILKECLSLGGFDDCLSE